MGVGSARRCEEVEDKHHVLICGEITFLSIPIVPIFSEITFLNRKGVNHILVIN
jgi:hypothetical protein